MKGFPAVEVKDKKIDIGKQEGKASKKEENPDFGQFGQPE